MREPDYPPPVDACVRAAFGPFRFPESVADVAQETLDRYRARTRAEFPDWNDTRVEMVAKMRAEANLQDRAEFRSEQRQRQERLRAFLERER